MHFRKLSTCKERSFRRRDDKIDKIKWANKNYLEICARAPYKDNFMLNLLQKELA